MTHAIFTLRSTLLPGDMEQIIELHATLYAREHGFNVEFSNYVAEHLREFARSSTERDRIWLAELNGQLLGCIAIVGASSIQAQLRWLLVSPDVRGHGLGKRLLGEAVSFCREQGYKSIFLWTVSALTAAAHLYRNAGFQKVEEHPSASWGTEVVEERYELTLEAQDS